mgnify:CR=1 FL=1
MTVAKMSHKSRWLLYTGFVYLLSTPFYFLMWRAGDKDSSWVYLLMFIPAITAVILRLVKKEGLKNVGWGIKRPYLLLLAIIIPVLIELITMLLAVAFGWGQYNPDFIQNNNGLLTINGIGLLFGNEPQVLVFFLFNFAISYLVGMLIMFPLVFGEEFGWRGYLQNHVLAKFSIPVSTLIIGLIWGLWHAPVVLLGLNFADYPMLGAFILMPLGTIGITATIGYFYQQSQSIWVATVFHASINTAVQITNQAMGASRDYLAVNLIWIGLWLLLGGFTIMVWIRQEAHTTTTYSEPFVANS